MPVVKAGLGTKEEVGQLSLKHEENFCMGGPGVILSRDTLFRVAPHVDYCLHHLLTSHEDVELGRCIHQFAGVTCTWSYEVLHTHTHTHSFNGPFSGTTQVSRYQKGKTNLDFTEARDSE